MQRFKTETEKAARSDDPCRWRRMVRNADHHNKFMPHTPTTRLAALYRSSLAQSLVGMADLRRKGDADLKTWRMCAEGCALLRRDAVDAAWYLP